MVGISVRGDHHLASGQIEIHLPNQLDDLFNRVQVADVNEQKLAAAVDQVDVDPEPPAGLVVHFDDVREQVFPFQHGRLVIPIPRDCLMIGTRATEMQAEWHGSIYRRFGKAWN